MTPRRPSCACCAGTADTLAAVRAIERQYAEWAGRSWEWWVPTRKTMTVAEARLGPKPKPRGGR